MEQKLNIAELLKDCPSGMELDCTLFDDVHFDSIDEVCDIIKCYIKDSHHKIGISFNKYGHYSNISKAKCVIFPKGKTTWVRFVPPCKFKDGDIVISAFGDIHLLSTEDSSYCSYRERWRGLPKFDETITTGIKVDRLATEEEKQELFDAIKSNGYKWNEETKTLEKLIEPKFKVGDRIKQKGSPHIYVIIYIEHDRYRLHNNQFVKFVDEKIYELVPNKFDINTLKPFDKVLVRNKSNEVWTANFYSHYDATSDKPFICVGWSEMNEYRYCIPYDVNKELLGTTNNSEEYGSR